MDTDKSEEKRRSEQRRNNGDVAARMRMKCGRPWLRTARKHRPPREVGWKSVSLPLPLASPPRATSQGLRRPLISLT